MKEILKIVEKKKIKGNDEKNNNHLKDFTSSTKTPRRCGCSPRVENASGRRRFRHVLLFL